MHLGLEVSPTGTEFGDRLYQFDLRFTKIVEVGKGRVDLNVDLYNAFNSDAILQEGPELRRGLAERHVGHPAALREVRGTVGFLRSR